MPTDIKVIQSYRQQATNLQQNKLHGQTYTLGIYYSQNFKLTYLPFRL